MKITFETLEIIILYKFGSNKNLSFKKAPLNNIYFPSYKSLDGTRTQ